MGVSKNLKKGFWPKLCSAYSGSGCSIPIIAKYPGIFDVDMK
jgi:hypothetical protein